LDEIDTTTRLSPSNHDPSSEETPQPELIGEYMQSLPTTMHDHDNVPYAVEAGTYLVVGIISSDRTRLSKAGVVFRARQEETGEVKTLVQFRDVREIRELAKAGTLTLAENVKALLADDRVLTPSEAKQETRRMGMRR
jgi:hypothetical protein